MKLLALIFGLVVALAVSRARAADSPPLVVHEWGTFTCLQDETGHAIGGINTDDEPVPGFVHRIGNLINASNRLAGYYQGVPQDHPSVTMRLETPVIYFHSPAGQPARTVGVDVAFHGGWLTEFYPKARFTAPGVVDGGINPADGDHRYEYGQITASTVGTLDWPAVQIGAAGNGPDTNDEVWTTPRNVSARAIQVGGESEKFLFYRGVGHIDSPLRVQRIGTSGQLQISIQGIDNNSKTGIAIVRALAHAPMWLVRVSEDGQVRWRRGYSMQPGLHTPDYLGEMRVGFADDAVGLPSLHKDMASFLVKAGLFPDEAEAMLNTWAISYFKSPGTRLFFLVPRAWTDAVLPLHITGNPPTVRVMVGRIEILTPRLDALVKQIETTPPAAPSTAPATQQALAMFANPPADVKAYILLGRFRDALLIYEQAKHPNPRLAKFMSSRGIEMHPLPLTGESAGGQ